MGRKKAASRTTKLKNQKNQKKKEESDSDSKTQNSASASETDERNDVSSIPSPSKVQHMLLHY
jgi:hypothetical protein